jgi:hypothetical protein
MREKKGREREKRAEKTIRPEVSWREPGGPAAT